MKNNRKKSRPKFPTCGKACITVSSKALIPLAIFRSLSTKTTKQGRKEEKTVRRLKQIKCCNVFSYVLKGKSLSEVPVFASTNPQYDDGLFIELQVQYMKIPSSEHGENTFCTEIVFDIENNFCTHHVLPIPMFCKKKSFWQRFTCVPSKRAEARFILNSWSKKIPSKFIQGHPNTALKYYSPTFAEEKTFALVLQIDFTQLFTRCKRLNRTKVLPSAMVSEYTLASQTGGKK